MGGIQNDAGTVQQEAGFGFNGRYWTESINGSLVAGTVQTRAGAKLLDSMCNRFTVGTSGDGMLLPPANADNVGLSIAATNATASKYAQIYAQGTDTINGIAGATGVQQMASSLVWYTCSKVGEWTAQGIGSGYSGANQTYSFADALTAGTTQTQAGGLLVSTSMARFTTVANPGDAGVLPPAVPGLILTVINAGANNMQVFPASAGQGGVSGGDQINSLGQNAAFIVPVGAVCDFTCTALGTWHTLISAAAATQQYNTVANTSGFTLTGANICGGSGETTLNLTGALGAGANAQLPTVAALVTALAAAGLNPTVGQTYELDMINTSSGAFAWTVTTNTGWTLAGTMTIAQNTTRKFYVTLNSLTTATLRSLGQYAVTAV